MRRGGKEDIEIVVCFEEQAFRFAALRVRVTHEGREKKEQGVDRRGKEEVGRGGNIPS